ncbi:hypothetical protein BC941DRAFT_519195 [Chlamydoabsidia padenii]|nr:hypothetical protein BC941DRAFT_519195 [Chlamydoabsidia padenii]
MYGSQFARRHTVVAYQNGTYGISEQKVDVLVASLTINYGHGYLNQSNSILLTVGGKMESLCMKLKCLISDPHPMKRSVVDACGNITGFYPVVARKDSHRTCLYFIFYIHPFLFYKNLYSTPVIIAPIILFTDDTSGNQSKQFNLLDSWPFTCAAMPFEEKNKRENMFYVSAVAGSSGLDEMDVVPGLVDDLLKLEDGVLMYSAKYKKKALVFAPILFISGDNSRHVDICAIKRFNAIYGCRNVIAKKAFSNNCTTC